MSVLGMVFGGKRKSSMTSVMTGVRSAGRVYKETQDVDRVGESVERLQQEKAAREAELAEQTKQLQAGPDPLTEPLEKIQIKPKKTNITVRFLGLVWKPE
jgi:TolA-binding protein